MVKKNAITIFIRYFENDTISANDILRAAPTPKRQILSKIVFREVGFARSNVLLIVQCTPPNLRKTLI